MSDLLAGLGFLFVIDGLLWAVAPDWALRKYLEFAELPHAVRQISALVMVAAGVGLVWIARG